MEIVIGWLVLAVIVAVAASSRGRSALGWFLLACIISPVLALVALLVIGRPAVAGQPQLLAADPEAPTPETHVRCPDCRELVRRDARKCKHCGAALIPQ